MFTKSIIGLNRIKLNKFNRATLFSLTFVVLSCSYLLAQEASNQQAKSFRNSVGAYVGLIEANVNYERNIVQRTKSAAYARIGLGYWTNLQWEGKYLNATFIQLLGKRKSRFEFDLGFKLIVSGARSNGSSTFVIPDIFAGYIYESPKSGEYFRIGISPISFINLGGGVRF